MWRDQWILRRIDRRLESYSFENRQTIIYESGANNEDIAATKLMTSRKAFEREMKLNRG